MMNYDTCLRLYFTRQTLVIVAIRNATESGPGAFGLLCDFHLFRDVIEEARIETVING